MDSDFYEERLEHPRSSANILEILTFGWTWEFFKKGQKNELKESDLYTTLNDQSSSFLGTELEKKWNMELTNAKPCLKRALLGIYGFHLIFNGLLLAVIELLIRLIQPNSIGYLIEHFDLSTDSLYTAIGAGIALLLSIFVCIVGTHTYINNQAEIGLKMRVAVTNIIYSKALRLSKTALGEASVGQMVNLLSNDVQRFDGTLVFLHYLWVGPLQTIIFTYFLWKKVGLCSVFGVVAMFMFAPVQSWLGKKISEFRLKTAVKTDERVGLMNEVISGIKFIKMYTWEKLFAHLIQSTRNMEVEQISISSNIKGFMVSFVILHTRIALFACTVVYYLLKGDVIPANKVFMVMSFMCILRTTLTVLFPMAVSQYAEFEVSIKRLQDFLLYEEKNSYNIDRNISNGNAPLNDIEQSEDLGIVFSNATAKWTSVQTENTLEKINLIVRPGQLIAVIGPVGAGKSSLLQAILRELPLSEGTISVRGQVSYASQEPWLFARSIKQNILFGSPMDKERYKKVVEVCALKKDFKQFPYGDKTIVGERGVTLSGGQKARINLARAIYKKADIYLLDDPLSAVDISVGNHLFEKCIRGYLKEKICILITHQLQYLTNVHQIVLMKNSNILAAGTYKEFQATNLDFAKLLDSLVEPSEVSENNNEKPTDLNNSDACNILLRKDSIRSGSSSIDDSKLDEPQEEAEIRSSGNVSLNVYSSYISAGGNIYKLSYVLFMFIFTQVLATSIDYWILIYHYCVKLEDKLPKNLFWPISKQMCIIVYAGFIVFMSLVAMTRSAAFVSVCMRSSINLHNKMFNSITRATMHFFNANSSGRILNRFSNDMGSIDELLPMIFMDCLQHGLTMVGILVVVAFVRPALIIPTCIIGIIFYRIRSFFLSTSRSVKRLEGTTRSPVLAHLNATLQGLVTIRAFEAEQILFKEFNYHQDLHTSAFYLFMSTNRAFGFCLDIVCFVYTIIVTFSFLIFDRDQINPNVLGVIITQIIMFAETFQWGMIQSAELENHLTSVERVLEFTNSPQESAFESSPDEKPPTEWPQRGQVTFQSFSLRYNRPDSPLVLKNLNINIESMEKVGIVGRTGAGKSSLIEGLFRTALNEGLISIDGIDINKLGLHDLRSKLSIIPQDPVLFSGTLRKNLDPFNEYPDHTLWNALGQVELKETIKNLPNGLNSKVSEGGSNFSVGQRQLVCLARAIVRNNKILVLDEATANVDPQTDELLQNTIKNNFRMCTVITIAHRLKTVMDSDKVLVMDEGRMVEFDHPFNLLKNKNGYLYYMVKQMGETAANMLHDVAAKSYTNMQLSSESTRL